MLRCSLITLMLVAPRLAAAQDPPIDPPARATVRAEIGLRRAGMLDQTLSPLHYGGGAIAGRIALTIPRDRVRYDADADLAFGSLSSDAGSAARPSLRAVASSAHLGVDVRLRRALGGIEFAPGLRLAARVAAREHHFTGSQSYGRFEGMIDDSYDEAFALQPAITASRALRRGATLSLSVAMSAIAVSTHPYFPRSLGYSSPWSISGPNGILLGDGAVEYARWVSARTALGVRYSVQLFRLRGANEVADVSHQLGATISWRRSNR